MSSPFLKWVGGKQKFVNNIITHFPKNIDTYHEPFLGGGSVLLAVLNSDIQIKKIRANDLNAYLIQTYIDVKDNTEELIEELKSLKNSEEDYYENRKIFNSLKKEGHFSVKASALFIYLNKTCFRGLYREGPNGFNVPFGHYKNPNWINADLLRGWSDKIKNVEFSCLPYQDFLNDVGEHDFVYLDPPYAPENKTSFTKYNVSDFLDHEQLFSIVKSLPQFVMSNSKTEKTLNAFASFEILEITTRRAINSKKPGSTTTEIIVIKM
ncbi:DNA methyltransferase [Paramecium bursaria Chlorella virus 1]|uniref:site-specific DNA-methyltransferase (adenine-specific) n=1 Tax=Paramecium bursaria Chlorella virus 1 TaxID=10506 RepID=O41063_PBCV1|nr:DNA methyltransferase [Paramecium bursaria Chlorella virus 1]AAC96931.1 6mA DNA methylase M.CviAI [Paramecium bursaria Chlorella virus 1]